MYSPRKRHLKIYIYIIFAASLFCQFVYVVMLGYTNMRWHPYKLNVKVALSSISYVTLNAVHNFLKMREKLMEIGKKQPQSRNDMQHNRCKSGLRMLSVLCYFSRTKTPYCCWSARLIACYRYIGNGLVYQFNTTAGADKVVSRREKGFFFLHTTTPCNFE